MLMFVKQTIKNVASPNFELKLYKVGTANHFCFLLKNNTSGQVVLGLSSCVDYQWFMVASSLRESTVNSVTKIILLLK